MKRSMLVAFLVVTGTLASASAALAEERCATMYEDIHFGGDRREIKNGADVAWIGKLWNDQVSSLWVKPGCVVNAYEDIDFGGAHTSFLGSVPWVGDEWNDKISSYTCVCE